MAIFELVPHQDALEDELVRSAIQTVENLHLTGPDAVADVYGQIRNVGMGLGRMLREEHWSTPDRTVLLILASGLGCLLLALDESRQPDLDEARRLYNYAESLLAEA